MKIHEYRGAMLHAKTMVIDGLWAAGGSINLDQRSFGLNHEGSLVVYDAGIARRRGIGHFLELFFLPIRNQL